MKTKKNLLAELASATCMFEGKGTTLGEADRLAEEFRSAYRDRIEALGYYLDAEPKVKDSNGKLICHSIEAIIYPKESLSSPDADEAVKKACNELPDIFRQKPVVISYSPLTSVYWLRDTR